MTEPRRWNLGAKLALVALPFMLLSLLAIAATLWVSWQLEGGAAAVNEAGRMRMQTYRLSLSLATALQLVGIDIPTSFVFMLPFLSVIIVLVIFARQSRLPSALGLPYHRGSR